MKEKETQFEVVNDSLPIVDDIEKLERTLDGIAKAAYFEVGRILKHIRDNRLYKQKRKEAAAGRYSFETWVEYCEQQLEMPRQRAEQLINAHEAISKMATIVAILPSREGHVRPLLALEKDQERADVWNRVVAKKESGETVTAKLVESERDKYLAEKQKNWITLKEWNGLSGGEQSEALKNTASHLTLNKQDNASIEWADWSWNPITGCNHPCPYCYARDIANRFYPQGFEPSIIPQRLSAVANTKLPQSDTGPARNIFTCSMADLFGAWVPDEWINAVLDVVRANPLWNFLFLTKFPKKMSRFDIPDNAWMGTSVDIQQRVAPAESAFAKIKCKVKWLSVEPMLTPLEFSNLGLFDWVVIGGASKGTSTPAWRPPMDWLVSLHSQAKEAGCSIYYKENAFPKNTDDESAFRQKDFPGSGTVDWPELPESLKYWPKEKDVTG